jgi:tetratricopeptide (TPR) repeat protein
MHNEALRDLKLCRMHLTGIQAATVENNLGLAYELTENLGDAVSAFENATVLNPELVEAHCNLANAKRKRGDTLGSLAAYETAIKVGRRANPAATAQAYLGRGACSFLIKDWSRAVADFDVAVRLSPTVVTVHINRCQTNLCLGNLPNALKDLENLTRNFRYSAEIRQLTIHADQLHRFMACCTSYFLLAMRLNARWRHLEQSKVNLDLRELLRSHFSAWRNDDVLLRLLDVEWSPIIAQADAPNPKVADHHDVVASQHCNEHVMGIMAGYSGKDAPSSNVQRSGDHHYRRREYFRLALLEVKHLSLKVAIGHMRSALGYEEPKVQTHRPAYPHVRK